MQPRAASKPRPRAATTESTTWCEVRTQLEPDELELLHFANWYSRERMKRLPLDALPPYVGTVLMFDECGEPVTWVDDWSGRTLHSRIEIDEIVADQWKLRRTIDGPQRAKVARRIRRRWWALVDHAIGYRVTACGGMFEFAP